MNHPPNSLPGRCFEGRLVTLWDMLRQYAYQFYHLGDILARLRATLNVLPSGVEEPEDLRPLLKDMLTELLTPLKELSLTMSEKELAKWKFAELPQMPKDDILRRMDVLRERIRDELLDRSFLYVPPEGVRHYDNFRDGWESALGRFSIAVDVEEAEKCFALARYSGCVYHLMRVAEIGAQQIAKSLKLPATTIQEPWGGIVRAVQSHVNKLPHKTAAQKKKQQKYAELADALYQVNLAWRIPAEHPRTPGDQYTEEQATEALGRVKALMRHLAALL